LLLPAIDSDVVSWLDGVYEEDVESPPRKPRLHRTRAPTTAVVSGSGTMKHQETS
jgi:hypothetical protein